MFKIKRLLIISIALCCGTAQAQTPDELRHNKNTDNVLSFGMAPDLKMWSPLNKINKSNEIGRASCRERVWNCV